MENEGKMNVCMDHASIENRPRRVEDNDFIRPSGLGPGDLILPR